MCTVKFSAVCVSVSLLLLLLAFPRGGQKGRGFYNVSVRVESETTSPCCLH